MELFSHLQQTLELFCSPLFHLGRLSHCLCDREAHVKRDLRGDPEGVMEKPSCFYVSKGVLDFLRYQEVKAVAGQVRPCLQSQCRRALRTVLAPPGPRVGPDESIMSLLRQKTIEV